MSDKKLEFNREHLKETCRNLAEYELMELTPDELKDKLNGMLKRMQAALKKEGFDYSLEKVEEIVKEVIWEKQDGEEE